MTGQVDISDEEGVRLLTISNPPRGYMNIDTASELLQQLQDAEKDPSVKVLVFTGGVPGVFIRHYDVSEIVEMGDAVRSSASPGPASREATPVYAMFDLLVEFPKPTIAAINGICMGGGFEFALACDIRIAQSGDYTIGLPETRLGIIPGLGGMQLLVRAVGLSRAREMVMRGRVVGPAEAHQLGMVHELADDAKAQALEVARDLASIPSEGISAVKRMAALVSGSESLEAGIRSAATEFLETLVVNDEAMNRMREFLETGEDITAR